MEAPRRAARGQPARNVFRPGPDEGGQGKNPLPSGEHSQGDVAEERNAFVAAALEAAPELHAALGRPFGERRRVCLPDLPEEVSRAFVHREVQRIAWAMRRILRKADLPRHLTMHSLRHSFCSLLISSGVSPVYVLQQAGHTDVGFTLRVYGSWFRQRLQVRWTAWSIRCQACR
jgi:hypothetical protein